MIMRAAAWLLLGALPWGACGKPAPSTEKEHVMATSHSPTGLHWKGHTVAPIGIALAAVDGAVIAEGSEAGLRYFSQTAGPVRLAVRAGTGQDLASWRRTIAARNRITAGVEIPTTLCGVPATKQEITADGERIVGGFANEHSQIVERDMTEPTTVHVAVAAVLRGEPLLVMWSIESAQRDNYRDDEARFFASVRCSSS